jgi:predicted nucleic acid-binding protein
VVTPSGVYLDASALVKLVLPEPESFALLAFLADRPRQLSSRLSTVEVARALRRRGGYDEERLRAVISQLTFRELDRELATAAGRLGPSGLRTLDAVHLATALSIQAEVETFVTYDARLADAARSHGLAVVAPA